MTDQTKTEHKPNAIDEIDARYAKAILDAPSLAKEIRLRQAEGIVPFIPVEAERIAQLLQDCALAAQGGRFDARLYKDGMTAEFRGRKAREHGVLKDTNPWFLKREEWGIQDLMECDPVYESWEHGWNEQDAVEQIKAEKAAQSQLLALAQTLAGEMEEAEQQADDMGFVRADALEEAFDAARAFTAADQEYQTTGAVPCPGCEDVRKNLEKLQQYEDLLPTPGAVPCGECAKWEAEQARVIKHCEEYSATETRLRKEAQAEASKWKTALECTGRALDAEPGYTFSAAEKMRRERDDLRRQLVERQENEGYLQVELCGALGIEDRGEWDPIVEAVRGLRLQLADAQENARGWMAQCAKADDERDIAQADNAALVKALEEIRRCKWPKELIGWTTMDCERLDWVLDVADKALRGQPHPGAPMLTLVNAVGDYLATGEAKGWILPDETLEARRQLRVALDAIRNRESR